MSYAYFAGRGRRGRDLGRVHIRKLVAEKVAEMIQSETYRGVTITIKCSGGYFLARNDREANPVVRGWLTKDEAVQAEKDWLDGILE